MLLSWKTTCSCQAYGSRRSLTSCNRDIVKEAARYPGESTAKIIRRVVEAAPELRFAPEHVEIVRMAGQSQVSLTEFDPRIKPGQRIDLYTSCITGTVYTKLHRLP